MKNILETEKITKNFGGISAINNLTISFAEGEITGLIGPNGSGKTTLVNVLTGFLPKDSGSTWWSGVEREKIRPWENSVYNVTRTFQQARLFEQISTIDNILVMLTAREPIKALLERHGKLHTKRAEEILKSIGLFEKRNTISLNLSYGQRKLLEMGRVIAMDSKIIFFDEPFAGLFPEMVKKIEDIILEFKRMGKTIILIEHNMGIIRKICDQIIVMDAGELLAKGRPEEVLDKKEVIEAYLGK